jgi:outer membrane protein assembly factor BamE
MKRHHIILLLSVALSGCATDNGFWSLNNLPLVYKIDIQQGNLITQDMVAQLQAGMDKDKVRLILGTPLLEDTFHADRWDYIYSLQKGGEKREQRRITLYFNGDKLQRIKGDVKPSAGQLVAEKRPEITVDVPGEHTPGFWDKTSEKLFGTAKPHTPERMAANSANQPKVATAANDAAKSTEGKNKEADGNSQEKVAEESFFSKVMSEMDNGQRQPESVIPPDSIER